MKQFLGPGFFVLHNMNNIIKIRALTSSQPQAPRGTKIEKKKNNKNRI